MSRCSSLNQARAYWSAKYSGSLWKRSEIARNSGSAMSATSVGRHHRRDLLARDVRVVGEVLRGDVLGLPLLGAGGALGELPLVLEEQVEVAVVPLRRVGGPGPSRPEVMVSSALPLPNSFFQPRPPECTGQPSGSGPTSDGSPPPCVLPNVWPPAMSATVSSLFMPMRLNVTLMSCADATGSACPSGPRG
jgi:hypothetical protein